jgi:hypothetical protein
MKMFGWRRYIIDEKEDTIWKKVKEPKLDLQEIIERYKM